jgi:hypothetical protein
MGFLANFSCKERGKTVLVEFLGVSSLFQTVNAVANAMMAPSTIEDLLERAAHPSTLILLFSLRFRL